MIIIDLGMMILIAGSLHPIEIFEFFYVLKKIIGKEFGNLINFHLEKIVLQMANQAIDFLKSIDKALDDLDMKALQEAQSNHDAMTALKIAQKSLYKNL